MRRTFRGRPPQLRTRTRDGSPEVRRAATTHVTDAKAFVAWIDSQGDVEAKVVLKDAYAKAGIPAEIEVYAGAAHRWTVPDSAVYNEAQAEKAWIQLLALFGKALA